MCGLLSAASNGRKIGRVAGRAGESLARTGCTLAAADGERGIGTGFYKARPCANYCQRLCFVSCKVLTLPCVSVCSAQSNKKLVNVLNVFIMLLQLAELSQKQHQQLTDQTQEMQLALEETELQKAAALSQQDNARDKLLQTISELQTVCILLAATRVVIPSQERSKRKHCYGHFTALKAPGFVVNVAENSRNRAAVETEPGTSQSSDPGICIAD